MCKQSNVRTTVTSIKSYNGCQALLTNFHLLLFGVTITIITKVGDVVAFSISLVSAVRAKLDSRYLQRQFSLSISVRKFHNRQVRIYPAAYNLIPTPISRSRNSYRRPSR